MLLRILVHRLNNPVFVLLVTDNLLTETVQESSYLTYQFGRDEIMSILHTFLQQFKYYNFFKNKSSYFKSI